MLDFSERLSASRWDETSTNAGSIDQVFISIEADYYGVYAMGSRRISADHNSCQD